MHVIAYSLTLLLEISCMKITGFSRMKCAETYTKHGCFRCSISSRDYQVHSLYKGHLPVVDTLVWSCGVRNSEIPLYLETACID